MKHFIYTCLLFGGCLLLRSQNDFNCSSHILYEHLLKTDPQFRKNTEQLEKETAQFVSDQGSNKISAATYIIPVVFHVIHTGGSGNISDAQIIDQVNILNKEFIRQQADTVLTPTAFKSLAAPFSVEFRLATLDPNGNCTNGINRIYSSLTNCSLYQDDIKGLSYWPSSKYLNVWVTQVMHYSGTADCVGGGYATFPGGNDTLDGINIRGDLIGNIGTAATNGTWGNFKGRYLIHELGHWFNLRHIWGDATCGNDQVADTPPAIGSNGGCPSFPHNAFSSCSGSGANGEMFTNYMDYTNGPCLNMFSAGQVIRMTAAMNSPSTTRHLLYTQSNLNATGTNNPYTYPPACVANPEVSSSGPIVACVGDTIKISDNSYGGFSTSRLWGFPGASLSSSTDSMVKVNYTSPGVYSFSLTKNYLGNSKTKNFTNKISVLGDTPDTNFVVPFVDDLEDATAFNNNWIILNRDNDAVTWKLRSETSYSGHNCIGINNYGNAAPQIDEIISPAYDLTNVLTPTLTFKVHYSTRTSINNDKLQVLISRNCGASWNVIYSGGGTALNTMLVNIPSPYIPIASSDEWRTEKANIMPALAKGIVRFKFSFTSGGGNNIFVDDINVDGINTTDIQQHKISNNLLIYPNPANKFLEFNYSSHNGSSASVKISDVAGRLCLVKTIVPSLTNEQKGTIDISVLNDGVYFIEVKQDNSVIRTSKFIKQGVD